MHSYIAVSPSLPPIGAGGACSSGDHSSSRCSWDLFFLVELKLVALVVTGTLPPGAVGISGAGGHWSDDERWAGELSQPYKRLGSQ